MPSIKFLPPLVGVGGGGGSGGGGRGGGGGILRQQLKKNGHRRLPSITEEFDLAATTTTMSPLLPSPQLNAQRPGGGLGSNKRSHSPTSPNKLFQIRKRPTKVESRSSSSRAPATTTAPPPASGDKQQKQPKRRGPRILEAFREKGRQATTPVVAADDQDPHKQQLQRQQQEQQQQSLMVDSEDGVLLFPASGDGKERQGLWRANGHNFPHKLYSSPAWTNSDTNNFGGPKEAARTVGNDNYSCINYNNDSSGSKMDMIKTRPTGTTSTTQTYHDFYQKFAAAVEEARDYEPGDVVRKWGEGGSRDGGSDSQRGNWQCGNNNNDDDTLDGIQEILGEYDPSEDHLKDVQEQLQQDRHYVELRYLQDFRLDVSSSDDTTKGGVQNHDRPRAEQRRHQCSHGSGSGDPQQEQGLMVCSSLMCEDGSYTTSTSETDETDEWVDLRALRKERSYSLSDISADEDDSPMAVVVDMVEAVQELILETTYKRKIAAGAKATATRIPAKSTTTPLDDSSNDNENNKDSPVGGLSGLFF